MKKTAVSIFFIFITININAQLTSKVDERFELTSIAFRLAEAEEYINNDVKDYVSDIDNFFKKYKNHKLIKFIQAVRKEDGVAYSAVSSSAFILTIKDRKIQIRRDVDIPLFLEDESRWTKETLEKYVNLLNLFYEDTKFDVFYKKHQKLYSEIEERFNSALSSINTQWFQSFFGQSLNNPEIYVSLCNGSGNYALSAALKNAETKYGIIIGCSRTDDNGIPVFSVGLDKNGKEYLDPEKQFTIIHELCHNFTNPLLPKYDVQMENAAQTIFTYTQDALSASAYGHSSAVIYEGLNNLFTNMYFKENGGIDTYSVYYNEREGFVWMRRAVKFMDNFYANRNIYVTIDDFMPQIVSFINNTAIQIETIEKEYDDSHPYVMNVFPLYNSTVSSKITEIRIDFSLPMHDSFGIIYADDTTLVIPPMKEIYWTEDKKTLIMLVEIDNAGSYGFSLNKNTFSSVEGFNMKGNHQVIFNAK